MYRNLNKKILHVIIIIVIVVAILSVAGILILRYQVEGEKNMPFKLTKIAIVGSVEGTEAQGTGEKWNLDISENNDIYIYIEKNAGYSKTEIIDNIEIKDININRKSELGETKLYKPVKDEKRMFINSAENEINSIIYTGELESNIKEQKISNQGGIVAFRYSINNLGKYVSNSDEQIDHSKLLQLININEDDLKTVLTFDISIKLTSGKRYEAKIDLDMPTAEIIEKGTVGIELTDFSDIAFKRVEN